MAEEIITFDEILADPHYKAEFDRRVTKALSTVQAKLDKEVQKVRELSEKIGGDGETIEDVKKQLADLQTKYDTDTKALQGQLDDRDYSDAINGFIAEKGLKFSSKSAEKAFISAFKEKKLERKDGAFVGADDFLKAQQEADPAAFSAEGGSVKVSLGGSLGGGGTDTGPTTLAGALRERYEQKG